MRYFRTVLGEVRRSEAIAYVGSVSRRAALLTDVPVLRYSLGYPGENGLNLREIFDTGTNLIINLAFREKDAAKLMGCMITIAAELAAFSRSELPPEERRKHHHIIIDECQFFLSRSAQTLMTILSQLRKYGIHLIMAHQNYAQFAPECLGAIQNAEIEVSLKQGHKDAAYSTEILHRPDPTIIKHEVADERAVERTHPVYSSLEEQRALFRHTLQDLDRRQAVLRLPAEPRRFWQFWKGRGDRTLQIRTRTVPDVRVDSGLRKEVEAEYLRRNFRPAPLARAPRGAPPARTTGWGAL